MRNQPSISPAREGHLAAASVCPMVEDCFGSTLVQGCYASKLWTQNQEGRPE